MRSKKWGGGEKKWEGGGRASFASFSSARDEMLAKHEERERVRKKRRSRIRKGEHSTAGRGQSQGLLE